MGKPAQLFYFVLQRFSSLAGSGVALMDHSTAPSPRNPRYESIFAKDIAGHHTSPAVDLWIQSCMDLSVP